MSAAESNSTPIHASLAPSTQSLNTTAPPGDELDDLFNYDVGTDDVFRDVDTNMDVLVRPEAPAQSIAGKDSTGLGIDEEIKVTRKRKPIAKLDHEKLLSEKGIPKLRRIAKDRLKFKGKGHEYTDVARLLNFYQLWLDDLYPRAKFADGLAIIEKLGHSRRMQVMRRQWIDEGKPNHTGSDEDVLRPENQSASDPRPAPPPNRQDSISNRPHLDSDPTQEPSRDRTPPTAVWDEGDLYTVSPRGMRSAASRAVEPVTSHSNHDSLFVSDDEEGVQPEEDELDALLAEDAANNMGPSAHIPAAKRSPAQDDFRDEEEAMAGMEDVW
ncbi:MAG: hypothetical protein M1819_005694 [Sarea resinae]|nr:MAG: hypothetical protein M1819_005694 [Sarea resinae]